LLDIPRVELFILTLSLISNFNSAMDYDDYMIEIRIILLL